MYMFSSYSILYQFVFFVLFRSEINVTSWLNGQLGRNRTAYSRFIKIQTSLKTFSIISVSTKSSESLHMMVAVIIQLFFVLFLNGYSKLYNEVLIVSKELGQQASMEDKKQTSNSFFGIFRVNWCHSVELVVLVKLIKWDSVLIHFVFIL